MPRDGNVHRASDRLHCSNVMTDYTLFHNPRCSKSRAVHGMLEERGIDFSICHYLEDDLTLEDLRALQQKLGLDDVRGMVRTKESAYSEVGGDALTGDQLLAAILAHRVLLERPILVRGDRAVIGRPPENAAQLL